MRASCGRTPDSLTNEKLVIFVSMMIKSNTLFCNFCALLYIVSRLTSDTQVVQNGLTTNIAMFLRSVIFIIVALVVQFIYSWKITLISIGFMLTPMCTMTVWAGLT